MKLFRAVVLSLIVATLSFAQSYGPVIVGGSSWISGDMQNVPAVAADLTTKNIMVDLITLTNTTTAAVTITIKDRSTNCNGAACSFLAGVGIPANTTQVIYLPGGIRFAGGINWVAGSANAITASVRGKQMP